MSQRNVGGRPQRSRRERKNRRNREEGTEIPNSKFGHEKRFNIDLRAQSENQKRLLQSLRSSTLTLAIGPAGTGKTFLSAGVACQDLTHSRKERVILTRPNIPTGRSIGYIKGSEREKLEYWLAPILSYFRDFMGPESVESHMRNDNLRLVSMETMRGRSFDNSWIIVDEAQNLTLDEIKCIVTRIGKNSSIVFCGDTKQSDLNTGSLRVFTDAVERHNYIGTSVIRLTIDDCVRSDLCLNMLRMFEEENW